MNHYKYNVYIRERLVARDMMLEDALILAKALFNEWNNEPTVQVRIERYDDAVTCVEE